jgi:hypothetical protein
MVDAGKGKAKSFEPTCLALWRCCRVADMAELIVGCDLPPSNLEVMMMMMTVQTIRLPGCG